MTHEHLDHIQGLLTAQGKGITLQADHVWMTASADPDYYATHPAAHKKLALEAAVRSLESLHGSSEVLQGLARLLAVNSSSTARCVDYLRTIGGGQPPHYLHRESALDGTHPFTSTTLRILAPEEDTSDYYGPARACLDAAAGGAAAAREQPLPPPGVDAGASYNLVDQMDNGLAESLFQIDAAANNTSLVVEITWRQRRLLFVGDAEQRSWQTMARQGLLRPVDFLKVGHTAAATPRRRRTSWSSACHSPAATRRRRSSRPARTTTPACPTAPRSTRSGAACRSCTRPPTCPRATCTRAWRSRETEPPLATLIAASAAAYQRAVRCHMPNALAPAGLAISLIARPHFARIAGPNRTSTVSVQPPSMRAQARDCPERSGPRGTTPRATGARPACPWAHSHRAR